VIAGRTYRRVRTSSGRTSSTWFLKKVLATMIVIGGISSLTIGGTFALFNSEESNTQSSIASGTLTLSDTVTTGTMATACFSYGPGSTANVNNTCEAAFAMTSQNYPGVTAKAKITILNNGTLDGTDLTLYVPSGCTTVATTGAPSPGGGDMCASTGALFYVQETDSGGTPTKCWYPSAAGTTCTITSTLSTFKTNYHSTIASLDLGSGPAHGASRYFEIGMQIPATATNTLQGEAAQFGLTWHITD
jgi:predicted ribosomally synthesized peptide with SipW-like signal peptide